MLLRKTLMQTINTLLCMRAIGQCARAQTEALLDKRAYTPIEVTVDGWFARLSCGWIRI